MKEILLPTKFIKWIFVASILILLSISVFLYLSFNNLFASYNLLSHSNTVSFKLEQVVSYLKDAETSQRGFLLTKDSMYLEPGKNAEKKVRLIISDLEKIIDNDQQKQELLELERLISEQFKKLHTTTFYYAEGFDDERKQTALMQSSFNMSRIRLLADKMEEYQLNVFVKQDNERKQYSQFTPALAIALILTALVIIAVAFYQLSRQLTISYSFQEQLFKSNIDLEEKKNELEQTNEELESFNYIASHDLKEPVRKIKTFSSMIMDSDFHKLSPKSQYNFERLMLAADRMQLLLNDLMAYTRVSTVKDEFSDVDINKVIQHLKDSMKESIEEKHAVIETQGLPVIKAIPFQITQLFENLVSNSIKYSKEDVAPLIRIQSSVITNQEYPEQETNLYDLYYKIDYEDNGIGFNQDYADKVFELFSRLHNNKNYPGTGIGLTICKKIIQNHNGLIKVFSEEHKGTRFEIYLPKI